MRSISPRCLQLLTALILFFSCIIILINHLFYKFPGNNYFPDNVFSLAVFLVLLNLGLDIYFTKSSKASSIARELIYFFLVMCTVAIATNAIQLTPFPLIDAHIIKLEHLLHINMHAFLVWTNNHPQLKYLLSLIYDSLPYQMSIIPLFVIFTCRFSLLREYYFLLLCTTFLGFGFYYFFPTAAPASVMDHTLFSSDQIATGLKFYQIHHYIEPTTNAGGLIALPSFHVIWAILCVYLIRVWRVFALALAIINSILIAACVLLGWHYCTDVIGSLFILMVSFYCLKYCRASH